MVAALSLCMHLVFSLADPTTMISCAARQMWELVGARAACLWFFPWAFRPQFTTVPPACVTYQVVSADVACADASVICWQAGIVGGICCIGGCRACTVVTLGIFRRIFGRCSPLTTCLLRKCRAVLSCVVMSTGLDRPPWRCWPCVSSTGSSRRWPCE